jgi:NADH:quinone reductase (non-electrogenic)
MSEMAIREPERVEIPGDDMDTPAAKKRILILGGGFAGAYTALHLEKDLAGAPDVEVALIAKENFVLFTPMLHEVAGSDVADTDIVQPLRKMLRRTRVGIANVEAIDLAKKQVRILHSDLPHPIDVPYDQLVLAVGVVTNFYHTPGLKEHALTMKTLGDAILVRNRIIDALELADNQVNETARKTTLTVVVAGGGFAGAETVGAVSDFLREGMKFYRHLKEDMLRVVLVHPGDVILPELGESLGRYAQKQLARRGVEIRLKTKVTRYDGQEVTLDDGTKIPTRMLIWTAGTTPPPVLSSLPCARQRGRVVANECLQVPDWPGVWALGDCALVPDPYNPGKYYPPTAQHAIRQAAVLAKNIAAAVRGQPPQPFKFKILGLLAPIGRRHGVAEILGMQFSGIIAWWLWRGIYLSKLPGLQKKVRVAIDWTLDLVFSKDLVQLPTLRSPTMSEPEESSTGTAHEREIPSFWPSKGPRTIT